MFYNVRMNKNKIQKRVIQFFESKSGKSLSKTTVDCCSEMARLVGCWVLSESPDVELAILKGELEDGRYHDILAVTENKVVLVDPTIWQIKKNEKDIFIGEAENVSAALDLANNFYGGKWSVSESLGVDCLNHQKEYEQIIDKNLKDI